VRSAGSCLIGRLGSIVDRKAAIGKAAALLALGGAMMVGLGASAPEQINHSPKAQKELAKALAGRAPGRAVTCIRNYPANQMHIVDDWTILFDQGGTVYVQNPRGGCPGIGTPGNVLITRSVGTNSTCSGDIGNIVHLPSGNGRGSCIFGPFVPYTKAN